MAFIADAISGAASSVADTVREGATAALVNAIEHEIEQHTGYHIDVEVIDKEVPSDWKDWMMKTGLNSIANSSTWSFLEYDRRKELFIKRGIKKIYLGVDEHPEAEFGSCNEAEIEWETGKDNFTIWFLPRAGNWESSNTWVEPGYKCWWNLCDEIVFGLQLYQLPGKCFYKSDWLEGFEDVDPDGLFPWSTSKFRRWFQFRHWVIFWYRESCYGYNWQWVTTPPKMKNGLDFDMKCVLSLPSMPDLSLPSISLPSLPDCSLPSLPSISAPSLSVPSLSAPSLSAPSLGSLPDMPEKKTRPTGRYDAHGCIEMNGLNVKADGKDLILSDATITHFWRTKGKYDTEKKEHQKLVLTATTEDQAKSWVESLIGGGAKEGEVGGCCTVA